MTPCLREDSKASLQEAVLAQQHQALGAILSRGSAKCKGGTGRGWVSRKELKWAEWPPSSGRGMRETHEGES